MSVDGKNRKLATCSDMITFEKGVVVLILNEKMWKIP